MKKYKAPKTEKLNISAQTILASSGSGSSASTSSPSTGFGGQTVGQGGMEAKQTTTTFTFD